MPRKSISVDIAAPCEVVFDTIHDYPRRLSWDTMLSDARLLDGAVTADVGVRSRCTGSWANAHIAMETEYIRFERGKVAAVKLTNQPPFFENFAATIKHEPLDGHRSRVTYVFAFKARPRALALLLEPAMNFMLAGEVRKRLAALKDHLESDGLTPPP